MKKIIHKSNTRGHTNMGWLDSYHSFSFGDYFNRERINFGALRVINDDLVAPGMGFGTHHHDNMEIISIPLEGVLEHRDSMNNVSLIKKGEIQVMSAGSGVYHGEYNKSEDSPVKFLQIWVFPDSKDVNPRYDHKKIDLESSKNKLLQILSPDSNDEGVWIHQKAWFNIGSFDANQSIDYSLKNRQNGVYLFIISGEIEIDGMSAQTRDGIGITESENLKINVVKPTEILIMEVPMIKGY